jgi:hypothetical protein
VIYRWTTDQQRYTEVAETLAFVVSSYADGTERGWAAVADQWLQPGGLDQEGTYVTYSLLCSPGVSPRTSSDERQPTAAASRQPDRRPGE